MSRPCVALVLVLALVQWFWFWSLSLSCCLSLSLVPCPCPYQHYNAPPSLPPFFSYRDGTSHPLFLLLNNGPLSVRSNKQARAFRQASRVKSRDPSQPQYRLLLTHLVRFSRHTLFLLILLLAAPAWAAQRQLKTVFIFSLSSLAFRVFGLRLSCRFLHRYYPTIDRQKNLLNLRLFTDQALWIDTHVVLDWKLKDRRYNLLFVGCRGQSHIRLPATHMLTSQIIAQRELKVGSHRDTGLAQCHKGKCLAALKKVFGKQKKGSIQHPSLLPRASACTSPNRRRLSTTSRPAMGSHTAFRNTHSRRRHWDWAAVVED